MQTVTVNIYAQQSNFCNSQYQSSRNTTETRQQTQLKVLLKEFDHFDDIKYDAPLWLQLFG